MIFCEEFIATARANTSQYPEAYSLGSKWRSQASLTISEMWSGSSTTSSCSLPASGVDPASRYNEEDAVT